MIDGLFPVLVLTKKAFGLPIPIPVYLDENNVGIVSDDSTSNISIATQNVGGLSWQQTKKHEITYTFRARKSNAIIAVVVSLMSQIVDLINNGEYDPENPPYFLSFYYDETFILKGYLTNFTKTSIDNTDLMQCSITISNSPTGTVVKKAINKVANAIPNILGA